MNTTPTTRVGHDNVYADAVKQAAEDLRVVADLAIGNHENFGWLIAKGVERLQEAWATFEREEVAGRAVALERRRRILAETDEK